MLYFIKVNCFILIYFSIFDSSVCIVRNDAVLQEVPMIIREIQSLLKARILEGEAQLDHTVSEAFASDMMSDVLAYASPHSALLTGLCNPQVIRTAEMMDMPCIIFVQGKSPGLEALALAGERDICILQTSLDMFCACGILYTHGLPGGGAHE